jgi:magnesium transporter
MIRTQLFDATAQTHKTGHEELIAEWRTNPQAVIWVDFHGHDNTSECELLTQVFGIHALALQDAQRERHPPKLETYEHYTFILFKALPDKVVDIEYATIQLAIFVSSRFFITLHKKTSPSTNKLWNEAEQDASLYLQSPGALALRLSRLMVDRYINIILGLEQRMETLEDEMSEHANDDMLTELIGYKSNLKRLRRVFTYHEQILGSLRHCNAPGFTPALTHHAVDVFEQQERASSLTGLYYELASDLIDGYISLASHKLNQIMKVLTIITAIFVPLGLIAGIYGMNFENMPELHSHFGYFSVLGLMIFIAVGLLYIFRKRKWI